MKLQSASSLVEFVLPLVMSGLVVAACGPVVTSGNSGDDSTSGSGGTSVSSSSSSSSSGSPTTGSGGSAGTGGDPTGSGGAGGSGGSVPVDFGPPACDSNLAIDDMDPYAAAKAIELCKLANGANDWGLIEAKWVLPDGAPIPADALVNYHLGHALYDSFGPNVSVRQGDRMLGLSSGVARRPMDPDYQAPQGGFSKGYNHGAPAGFPKASPICPGIVTGNPADGAALEVTLRAPTAAHSFSFDIDYYTVEYPEWVCTTFNDAFVALLSPTPPGQPDGNISFDSMGNVISVNNVFLQVCSGCNLGDTELLGTGYDDMQGGATGWLTTTAPVTGGDVITLRWTVYDSSDQILDSATLIDKFQWSVVPNSAVSTTRAVE